MFTLFNASAPSWNLLLFALLEVVVVAWLYGAENFLENLSGEMGIKLNRFTRLYWIICWKWLTPAILTGLLLMAWATFGHVTYDDGYVYPIQVQILGYLITGCTVIWIPVNLRFNPIEQIRSDRSFLIGIIRFTKLSTQKGEQN